MFIFLRQVYTAVPGGQYVAFERNILKAMRKVLREEGFLAFWKVSPIICSEKDDEDVVTAQLDRQCKP